MRDQRQPERALGPSDKVSGHGALRCLDMGPVSGQGT